MENALARSRARAIAIALLAGCGHSAPVGTECDELAARLPFYRVTDGQPAYSGQALLLDACASCHAEGLIERHGAPADASYDARLVIATGEEGIEQARRLFRIQGAIFRARDAIYGHVLDGVMPPEGFVPSRSGYAARDGTPMPGARDPAGIEMLRNWLACGAPVVERTTAPTPVPCIDGSDCVVTMICDSMGECRGVGDVVPAVAIE
jgi:hypothetical protein